MLSVPAPQDFKENFPAFEMVPEKHIQAALLEATSQVDDTWPPDQGRSALLLYAAHLLTLNGQGTGAEATFIKAGGLSLRSVHAGSLTLERHCPTGENILNTTLYGQRFLDLLKVTHPSIWVA